MKFFNTKHPSVTSLPFFTIGMACFFVMKVLSLFSSKIQWCSSCNSSVNSNCTELNHKVLDSKELFSSYSLGLETTLQRARQTHNSAMDDWKSVQYVNRAILNWLGLFVTEMKKREASNSEAILHLESLKVAEQFDVPQEETDIPAMIANFNELISE